jgi:D-3-phosphoglycerate dehydrogenase / 2-oxoglutarate reductase
MNTGGIVDGNKYKVLVTGADMHPEGIDLLRPCARLEFLESPEAAALEAAVGDVDAIFCRSGMISAAVIEAAPRLKIVSRHGVGYDNVDVDACSRSGVLVTTTGEANSQSVSELAFGLILALARDLVRANAEMDAGRWQRGGLVGTELYGKTLGIVGLGRVGRRLARHAAGFDLEVLACDPYLDAATVAKRGARQVDLPTLLAQADFVSLHLPLNTETRHLIDAAALAQMKETAFLVNAARGGLVDEAALYTALTQKQIAGAALDVFDQEPLPGGHPLVGLDTVCHTPHIAGQSAESLMRMSVQTGQNILTVLRGERLDADFIVNPAALSR